MQIRAPQDEKKASSEEPLVMIELQDGTIIHLPISEAEKFRESEIRTPTEAEIRKAAEDMDRRLRARSKRVLKQSGYLKGRNERWAISPRRIIPSSRPGSGRRPRAWA